MAVQSSVSAVEQEAEPTATETL